MHKGLGAHRLASNPEERAFARAWKDEAPLTLPWLLGDGYKPAELEQHEATVAATVVQWLGSHVGQCFLHKLGYEKLHSYKAQRLRSAQTLEESIHDLRDAVFSERTLPSKTIRKHIKAFLTGLGIDDSFTVHNAHDTTILKVRGGLPHWAWFRILGRSYGVVLAARALDKHLHESGMIK